MIFKIIWSDFAESQLDEIFEYFEKRASSRIAKDLINGIITAPDILIKSAYIGHDEESFKHRKVEYWYLCKIYIIRKCCVKT